MKNPSLKNLKALFLLLALFWQPHTAHAAKNILVFGDSLSAGYGIAAEQSWPSLLQQELDRGRARFKLVNASISGETTLGGRQRLARLLEQYRPAIVIVELGANDGLRGFSTADIESNLNDILMQVKQAHAQALLVGMKLPPNYGAAYIAQFQGVFTRLAEEHQINLLPFLLEGVTAEQFQADNLHPTAAAQPQIMKNVQQALKPLLR
ncbi:MAG: arylesterase [Gallionellales bacterium CG_4_10_14_3_um_filter_54_96]|nr:MAG: arylesterase [Gallionellales bacterium CG03_land_8_20_14_0_80_55_15]PIY04093.1 MAG: arylesterase [Gallionellales bacterium CG_4_10_14_3_um_filter_54_96]PJC05565.1 MAG: arylesterase [Gallionellales bacterium CG_4_9_14_0_8_um_filter_55_61]